MHPSWLLYLILFDSIAFAICGVITWWHNSYYTTITNRLHMVLSEDQCNISIISRCHTCINGPNQASSFCSEWTYLVRESICVSAALEWGSFSLLLLKLTVYLQERSGRMLRLFFCQLFGSVAKLSQSEITVVSFSFVVRFFHTVAS